jgi:hypothetical protein
VVRTLVVVGIVAVATASVEILFAEGASALRRPLDFRGDPPNREPVKRATFHLILVAGVLCMAAALVVWALSR